MEQRRLRLGDILDDYCPRERRLTNHAVVAMIEEDVKQTRCTTCDAEHVYKGGKVPRRRKKETPSALYKEVLAGMPEADASPVLATGHLADPTPTPAVDETVPTAEPDLPSHLHPVAPAAPSLSRHAREEAAPKPVPEPVEAAPVEPGVIEIEEGPVHRPLIRAQLPRIEGHKEERRLPEFTIRQAGRGGFRGGDARMKQRPAGPGGNGGNGGNGNNRSHGGPRFAGPRPGGPGGPGRSQPGRGGPSAGFRGGAGQPRQGGPKKRSR
jgi:hypothetical protein